MFYHPLMTDEERALQQEVRTFVRDEVSHDFIRALVYMAARAVDTGAPNVRRIVSEAKRFATDAGWEIANKECWSLKTFQSIRTQMNGSASLIVNRKGNRREGIGKRLVEFAMQ